MMGFKGVFGVFNVFCQVKIICVLFAVVGSFGFVHAVTKLTDSTYTTAIASCLGESEQAAKDGMCTSYGAASGYGTMPNWDVSMVTTLGYAFEGQSNFNASIGNWNTAQVTRMNYMFNSASAFNQDIGGWNTEKVTNMQYMFQDARAFNQNIGSWNTAQVTNMYNMFYQASAFNHDISSWTGSPATTVQTNMFLGATAFQAKFACTNAVNGPPNSCVPR